jgi:hypothetical protein
MSKLLFTVILLSSSCAWALEESACGTVDLTSEFPSHRDQSTSEGCYAFSTADLLTHALKIKPPDKVSAMDIYSQFITLNRVRFAAAQKNIVYENISGEPNGALGPVVPPAEAIERWKGWPVLARTTGFADVALSTAISTGHVCLEREVPSQSLVQESTVTRAMSKFTSPFSKIEPSIYDKVNGDGGSLPASPVLADTYWKSRLAALSIDSLPVPEDDFFGDPRVEAEMACSAQKSSLSVLTQFGSSLERHVHDWAAAKFRSQIKSACKHPVETGNLKVHTANFDGRSEDDRIASLSKVQEIFARKDPFVLSFDICQAFDCPGSLPHAILASGRKWNEKTKACEVLLHDSFGSSCPAMGPREGVRCENGDVWITAEKLASLNHRIVYLEKPTN